ncbi:hypothetical protein HX071_18070 [Myroides marinus]|uniref:DUF6266 family protein n=1 Tax=Myroides marinus TaxID=703342 RepID=UPI002575D402|nr:DUF6266 family protein [Myroides marinus]MDM1504079.1 hypothetical protein [Myroides marinus]
MAEIKEGILGGVNGKIGPVVGFKWRGRNLLRTKPSKSHKEPSDKQIIQRSKMGIVSTFASKVKDFVNEHYPLAMINNKLATGKEQLVSMLLKEGVLMIDGEPCIDISTVLLSMGTLPAAAMKKITRLKTGRVKVSWDESITNVLSKGTDRLTMVVYSEVLDEFDFIESIAKREDKFVHFDLPTEWVEGDIHLWSVWKSANGKLVSTSTYHNIIELGVEEASLVEQEEVIVPQSEGASLVEKEEVAVSRNEEISKYDTTTENEVGTECDQKEQIATTTNTVEVTTAEKLMSIEPREPRSILEAMQHFRELTIDNEE